MTALVLFPIGLGILLVGAALAWPVAYRAGLQAPERAQELAAAHPVEIRPAPEVEGGYHGQHRIGDETVRGSTAQRATIAALRAPTAEFAAIVATSYRSGEFPLIGRPTAAYLRAHMAAVSHG